MHSWHYLASERLQAYETRLSHSVLIFFLFGSVIHQDMEEFDISGSPKHLDEVGRAIMVHQNLASICYILPLGSQDCIVGSVFVNLCRHQICSSQVVLIDM